MPATAVYDQAGTSTPIIQGSKYTRGLDRALGHHARGHDRALAVHVGGEGAQRAHPLRQAALHEVPLRAVHHARHRIHVEGLGGGREPKLTPSVDSAVRLGQHGQVHGAEGGERVRVMWARAARGVERLVVEVFGRVLGRSGAGRAGRRRASA